jgi:hypothetical protein
MLILIDLGSLTSFISQKMVNKLGLSIEKCEFVRVKLANEEMMLSDQLVQKVEWWVGGHTYNHTMRVLDLGAYDAILGFDLLTARLIVPSTSPFAFSELLVQKKDGSWRFCVDYRKLNAMTIKNRFPMPLVDEIIDELAGTQFYTSLDMTTGYHQICMGNEDEYKTPFKTHQGHNQFRVMPFILTNASASFQCAMNSVLSPYLRKFVMVFLDDILVYSTSMEEHLHHLRMVFTKLRENKIYLKSKKCNFTSVDHLISIP